MRQEVADAGRGATHHATLLRPLRDADLTFLKSLRADAALQSLLLTVPALVDDVSFEGWLQRRRNEVGGCFLIVTDHEGAQPAGYVQITQVHRNNGTGYGGIVLAEEARGRGLGRSALSDLAAHARRFLGLRKLMAEIRSDNVASINLHLSAGYREVGVLHEHFVDVDGRFHDVKLFERRIEEL